MLENSRQNDVPRSLPTPDFIKSVIHEINVSLTGIIGITNLLGQEQMTAKQYEYVNDLRISGDRLHIAINNFLKEIKSYVTPTYR
jgi:signal transduction histidine kinase